MKSSKLGRHKVLVQLHHWLRSTNFCSACSSNCINLLKQSTIIDGGHQND